MKIKKREISKTSVRGVIKRGEKFILRVKIDGRQIWRTLQATNIRDAAPEAKRLRATLLAADEDGLKATASRGQYPTLAEVVKIYEKEGRARMLRGEKFSLPAMRRNMANLARFAGGSLEISCGVLTKDSLMAFARNWLSGYEDQPLVLNRRRTSLVSMHGQARSVFAQWALEEYTAAGFSFPASLWEWKKAKPAIKPSGKYRVPLDHPDLVAKTIKAGRALTGELGIAWLLCFEMALRAGEARAFQMSWITPAGQHFRADIIDRPVEAFTVKGTARRLGIHRDVFFKLERFRAELDHFGQYALPGAEWGSILEGRRGRGNIISLSLSAWMRGMGWTAELFNKCGHELRKLQGSRWFSDPRLGPAVAQEWLGHADVSTTCKYYAALATNPEPLPPA
jgi:integrase